MYCWFYTSWHKAPARCVSAHGSGKKRMGCDLVVFGTDSFGETSQALYMIYACM